MVVTNYAGVSIRAHLLANVFRVSGVETIEPEQLFLVEFGQQLQRRIGFLIRKIGRLELLDLS